MSTGAALLLTIGIMIFIGFIISAFTPKCSMSGCDRDAKEGSRYCYLHNMSYRAYGNPDYNQVYKNSQRRKSSTSNSKSTSGFTKKHRYSLYDEDYEDMYENDDYDWDRYN